MPIRVEFMDGQKVASLYGVLGLDDDEYNRKLDGADRKAENFGQKIGRKFQQAGAGFVMAGLGIGALVAPLVGFGAAGLEASATFESSMNEISARTGLVGEDLQTISEFALQMGADTAFSAQQAADGFLQLLSSGSDAEEAIAALPHVMDLAAASGMDLGTSADVLTDILAQFGLKVQAIPDNFVELQNQMGVTDAMMKDFGNDINVAPEIVDMAKALGMTKSQLYDAWNSTKTLTPEIERLAASLGLTESDFISFGQSLHNFTPAFAQLVNESGIAGDRLIQMFTGADPSWYVDELVDAADVTNILAKAAGASSATVADLAAGFANVGPVAAMYGLNVEESAAALAVLSENGIKSAEAGTALKSLLQDMTRPTNETTGALRALGVSLYDTNGEVRDFDSIIDDLDSALDKLPMNEQIRLSKMVAGGFSITAFNAFRAAGGIDEMQAAMDGASTAGEVADARMAGFNGAVEQLRGSMETLSIRVMTPFMQNVLTPMVGRITPIINSFTEWAATNPELVSQIASLVAVVAGASMVLIGFGAALTLIGTAISGVSALFAALLSPIGLVLGAVAALGVAWATNFGGIRDFVDREVTPRLQAFFGWLGGVWESIRPGLTSIWDWFTQSALPAVVDFIEAIVMPAIGVFIDLVSSIWDVVSIALGRVFGWFMESGLPPIIDLLQGPVLTAVQGFIDILSGIWDIVGGVLGNLYNWFMVDGLPFVIDIIEAFISLLTGLWVAVEPALSGFVNGITDLFGNIITNVIQPMIDKVLEFINWVKEGLTQLGILKSEQLTFATGTNGEGVFTAGGQIPIAGGMGFAMGGWTGGSGGDVAGVVHEQEWVIPTRGGPLLREGSGKREPEMMFGPGAVLIYANDAAGGARAADAFQRRLTELRRSKGR